MRKNYLVGYDITDEKRLLKVGKIMQGFGSRVQYSFFHCVLSETQKRQMEERLQKIIKEGEDQVLILPVTDGQIKDMEFLGYKTDLSAQGIIIV